MKKKVLSIMMAAAMTLSVSAFATAVTAVNNTTTTFAETNNSLNLRVIGTNMIFANAAYSGRGCIGDTIKYNAIADGADTKYDISISLRNGMGHGNESYSNLSGATDMSWTPQYAGEYQITITAKNETLGVSETKYLHYYISPKLEITNFTGDYAYDYTTEYYGHASTHDEINLETTSCGGAGQVTYTYTVTARNGRYNPSYKYVSTDGKFKWIPMYGDIYQIDIHAEDQLGHTADKAVCYSIAE